MKQVFLILAHKNPDQLEKLVNYLSANNCKVFVHIDRKQKKHFRTFISRFLAHKNIQIFAQFKVYWGGYSQIRATFFLLKKAVADGDFDFVNLISGQDLPVARISAYNAFLEQHKDKSFVSYHKVPAPEQWSDRGGLDRVEYFWITAFPKWSGFFFNRFLVIINAFQRRLNIFKKSRVQLYGGANWFTLNKEMAVYVSALLQKNPAILHWYKNTRCADEIILQTILMNSPFREKVVDRCLRLIDWSTGPEFPRTFRLEDKERLLNSGEFFARKFDEQVDKEIIDHIYKHI